MKLKSGPESQDRRRWLDDPYTRIHARVAAKTRAERLGVLLNVCAVSSDPKVMRALADYEHAREDADFLGADGEKA